MKIQSSEYIEPKPVGKVKKKRKKLKSDILQLYSLDKIKFTMELDPTLNMSRFQVKYSFFLKDEENTQKFLDDMKQDKLKKCQLDAKFHAKFIQDV